MLERLTEQLCEDLERKGRRGRTVRHQGAARGLLHPHTGAHPPPPRERGRDDRLGGAGTCAASRPPPRAPARRPRRGPGLRARARPISSNCLAGRRSSSLNAWPGPRTDAQRSKLLHLEDASSHMHVASVMLFDGDPPPYVELLESIDRRLHLVLRYRQKRGKPLGQGRPRWVDDPHLNLRDHVRSTALPSPGTEGQLRNLGGPKRPAQLWTRDKPRWEIWWSRAWRRTGFALLAKTHHALVGAGSRAWTSCRCSSTRWKNRLRRRTRAGSGCRGPLPSGAQLLGEAPAAARRTGGAAAATAGPGPAARPDRPTCRRAPTGCPRPRSRPRGRGGSSRAGRSRCPPGPRPARSPTGACHGPAAGRTLGPARLRNCSSVPGDGSAVERTW